MKPSPRQFRPCLRWGDVGLAGATGCLILLMGACAPAAFGQDYYIQNWHVEDGLPDGQITAIQQTAGGSLWIGTPKGLARFDGVGFKVFKAGFAGGLTDSRITCLLASRDGTLWISTQDGNIVRYQHGSFERVPLPPGFTLDLKDNRAPGGSLWERRMQAIEGSDGARNDAVLDSRFHLVEDGGGYLVACFQYDGHEAESESVDGFHANQWTAEGRCSPIGG
jgi:hypothetical protein